MISKVKLAMLNVSLTKHGAHKLALLLRKHSKDHVLSHVWEKEPGINIDLAQAKKNLSVGPGDVVPTLWDEVRTLGEGAIDALVLIAIVFSHHELMAAMAKGRTGPFRGRITPSYMHGVKEYTNFAGTFEELGFSLSHTQDEVTYDLRRLFSIPGLSPLARDLLVLKLKDADWDVSTDPVEEMIANNFHESLSISPMQFRDWLRLGVAEANTGGPKDADFLSGADEVASSDDFKFRAGHRPKKTGTVIASVPAEERTATLRHNEIQTALYNRLVIEHGLKCVGTEVPTGMGTAIDVVVRLSLKCRFYEIKVADTLRACLRQAIPQLLEYAYWRCDDQLADQLIVLGTFPVTPQAEAYLAFLRGRFGLPIYYEQFID